MTQVPSKGGLEWSRQRWFWTIVFLLCFQVALVFFLSRYEISDRNVAVPSLRIRLSPEIGDRTNPLGLQSSSDPTLFALVHPMNFSGSAWLKAAELPYTPSNRIEPPTWLRPDPRGFGDEFAGYVRSTFPRFLRKPDEPNAPVLQGSAGGPLTVGRANLTKEGDLADRRLISRLPLPASVPEQILANCVVSVVVDARGETLSAVLLNSSGSNTADQDVLGFASSARFAPVSEEASDFPSGRPPFAYGTLVFRWLAARSAPSAPRLIRD